MSRDSRETSLAWLRDELAKAGVRSYILPANNTQGPSLHCGWGESMVTVNMCYGSYLFRDSSEQWVKVPGNRAQECADKILAGGNRGGGRGI